MRVEQMNAELVRVESAKNAEIQAVRLESSQHEQVAAQLNQQLQLLQGQVEEYKKQVSNRETASISNQHQLHHRLQQQDSAIQILVEEKGELINRIKQLEEEHLKQKVELEGKVTELRQLDQHLNNAKAELKTFKEYFDQNEQQKEESDEKLRVTQQVQYSQKFNFSKTQVFKNLIFQKFVLLSFRKIFETFSKIILDCFERVIFISRLS